MKLAKAWLPIILGTAALLSTRAATPTDLDLESLLLLGELATTPNEVQFAIARCEEARSRFESQGKFNLAFGILCIKNKDFEGAEAAFQKAKEDSGTAVAARVAIGNLYISKRAISSAPSDALPRVDYPSFYEQVRTIEHAWTALGRMVESAPDSFPNWFWLNASEIALTRREFDVAEKAVKLALRQDLDSKTASLLLGRIQLIRGDTTDAISTFQRALEQDSTSTGHLWLGRAYLMAGDNDAAKRELNHASALDPELVEPTIALADLEIREGNAQEAIRHLNDLLAQRPRIAEGYRSLGAAYLALEDSAKAASAFRRFRALAPADPRGPKLLGIALRAEGKLAEARRQLETALRITPTDITVLGQLVAIDVTEGQTEDAAERVRRLLIREPESAPLQGMMGNIQLAQGDLEAAESSYLSALRLDPGLDAIRLQLAQVYSTTERWDDALRELDKLLSSDPDNPSALLLAGSVHQTMGQPDQAQKLYERALAVQPRNALAANNLAYIHMQRSTDLEKALSYAEMAHREAPNSWQIADTLGWVYYLLGRYEEALTLIEPAAAELNDVAGVQFHLGMVYYRLGRNAAARKTLERALGLDAELPGADDARRVLSQIPH